MERADLVGFIADPAGDDDHLNQVVPVVRTADGEFTSRGLDWKFERLQRLDESQRRYVNYVRPSDVVGISEGETVWLAGRNFFADVQSVHEAKTSELGMGQWATHTRGLRWSHGTYRAFDEFAQRLATLFESRLHNFLFDSMEKLMGDADVAFRVYNALPIPDTRERELNRGLYFLETRDEYSREFVRREAVKLRLFRNVRDYDRALVALRARLSADRLSEGWVASRASQNLRRFNQFEPSFATTNGFLFENETRETSGAEVETGVAVVEGSWASDRRG